VCYFYALKASKKLLDSKKNKKILNIGFLMLMVTLSVVLLTQFIEMNNKLYLCHTFSFVVPQLVNCIVSFGFVVLGFKIQKAVSLELSYKKEAAKEQL